eukprot:g5063.t1
MFVENGPFVLDENLNVTLNPYSWNKVANVLYLEQPARVGSSYTKDASQLKTNDAITSQDTYDGLQAFLTLKHTELQGRDFFIAGESYGGHHVPMSQHTFAHYNPGLAGKSDLNVGRPHELDVHLGFG